MEFREFVEKAFEVVTLYKDTQAVYGTVSRKEFESLSDTELESLLFERTWASGGHTGKSCWGGEGYSRSGDTPEDITPDVAKVLLAVGKSDIGFVTYMATVHPLVKSTSLSDSSDYYGNYTNYARLYVNLKELYDVVYGDNDE
jgi:hypothetical protein